MNVQQKFKLLIFPKWNKASADGEAPIYVRIKIDGDEDEISLGCKITEEGREPDKKRAKPSFPLYAAINKKIERALVDLGRHFDGVQAKDGTATLATVKASYMALPVGQQTRNQKVANLEFNQAVDDLIGRMLGCYKKREKAEELRNSPIPEMTVLLQAEKAEIGESLKELIKVHQRIFSDPNRKKTIILTLNDYFVHATGVFNNGNVGVRRIITNLAGRFGIEVSNPSRVFQEILARKKGRLVLLNRMIASSERRMDRDDL